MEYNSLSAMISIALDNCLWANDCTHTGSRDNTLLWLWAWKCPYIVFILKKSHVKCTILPQRAVSHLHSLHGCCYTSAYQRHCTKRRKISLDVFFYSPLASLAVCTIISNFNYKNSKFRHEVLLHIDDNMSLWGFLSAGDLKYKACVLPSCFREVK